MRTKTLLIAAATALAAAVTSAQAQTVYSQNIVGYVNLALTPGSDELVAPALDVDGTGTNGTITTVVGTNVAVNTAVLIWNGSGFDTLTYSKNPSAPHGATVWWTATGGVNENVPNYPINVGQGFFIDDPTDTNLVETGVVMQGTLVNNLPAGSDSLVASIVPIGGDLTTNLNYLPTLNDSALIWTGSGYQTYTYSKNPSAPHGATVWWTSLAGVNTDLDPQITVGQGFFIVPAAANAWTETFTNN